MLTLLCRMQWRYSFVTRRANMLRRLAQRAFIHMINGAIRSFVSAISVGVRLADRALHSRAFCVP